LIRDDPSIIVTKEQILATCLKPNKSSILYLLVLLYSAIYPLFYSIWLFLTKSWQHSMNLTDSNSALAEICISYLWLDIVKEHPSFLEYSADHYRMSGKKCQAGLAAMTRALCRLPERRKQLTELHNENDEIPINGSPLCLASALGIGRAVELFLPKQDSIGVDPENEVDSKDEDGLTPLSWAACNGHEAVVKLLLKTDKVDVDSKDEYGHTPLLYAAANGHEAVVKLLLGKRDSTKSKDKFGQTPLSHAAKNEHEAGVKLLLDEGADTESKDDSGRTPLSWAVKWKVHEAVVQLLLDKGRRHRVERRLWPDDAVVCRRERARGCGQAATR
jgi:hypothetical protein